MTYKLRKEIKTKDKQIFTDVPWTAQQLSHMMQFMTKHYDKTSSTDLRTASANFSPCSSK